MWWLVLKAPDITRGKRVSYFLSVPLRSSVLVFADVLPRLALVLIEENRFRVFIVHFLDMPEDVFFGDDPK